MLLPAALAAGVLRGISPGDIIVQAARFASKICGIAGAVPMMPVFMLSLVLCER
jgi:hypothetical protein